MSSRVTAVTTDMTASRLAAGVAVWPVQPAWRDVVIPADDGDTQDPIMAPRKARRVAGQSFMIEYVDAKGKASRRRITVSAIISATGGVPSLQARCHECRGVRQFRVDRITCCIDFDGEVFDDVPLFLQRILGLPAWSTRQKEPAAEVRWRHMLGSVEAEAVILAALSRVDGKVVAEEITAIGHVLAPIIAGRGLIPTPDETIAIARHVGRLRPGEETIRRALDDIRGQGPDHIHTVLTGAVTVVRADGLLHPAEIALINDVSIDLLGGPLI